MSCPRDGKVEGGIKVIKRGCRVVPPHSGGTAGPLECTLDLWVQSALQNLSSIISQITYFLVFDYENKG